MPTDERCPFHFPEDERAALLQREQGAREEAEAAQRRLEFLVEASTILAGSLDYETTLGNLARLAVPRLADWCTVYVADKGGGLAREVAVAHVDTPTMRRMQEVAQRYRLSPEAPHGPPNVMRTGVSELYPEIPEMLLGSAARWHGSEEYAALLRQASLASALVVPMVARGRTLGAIAMVTADSARRYGAADLAMAEELARRAALMVDNARLYREAEEARTRAEASSNMKDEFLAIVSHEMRSPLTAMLGWARLLRGGSLDEATQIRAADTIERNAQLQAKMIGDLLDVSRIVAGTMRLSVCAVDLAAVIHAALDSLRPQAAAKQIRLEMALDPTAGPVSGDPDRLQQIVWNLLSNALKFTPQGGHVAIRLERSETRAQIRVSDSGEGISPDFLPHVFDRFRQADASTTRSHGGLGLGLAIVKHLMELHGGAVRAESPGPGQGATFTVELPIRAVRAQPAAEPLGSVRTPSPSGSRALGGLQFLVVDDEADARDLLAFVLEQAGASVRLATSAQEALAQIERARPDILVSDIAMPAVDGYELIRRVRASEEDRRSPLPALALTAYARAEDRRRALQAGYQMHAAKPIDPAELVSVVAHLAGWGRGNPPAGTSGSSP